MSTHPIRTFSIIDPTVGWIEFSIPLMNPQEVERYVQGKAQEAGMPAGEAYVLVDEMLKQATDLWNGHACWIGDPVAARLKLRNDPEVAVWQSAH